VSGHGRSWSLGDPGVYNIKRMVEQGRKSCGGGVGMVAWSDNSTYLDLPVSRLLCPYRAGSDQCVD